MTVIARASGARAGAGAPRALTVSSNFARRRRDPILARWLADLDRASRSDNWPALEVLCGFPHADVGAAVAVLAMRGRARELGNVLEKRLDTTRPAWSGCWTRVPTRTRGGRDRDGNLFMRWRNEATCGASNYSSLAEARIWTRGTSMEKRRYFLRVSGVNGKPLGCCSPLARPWKWANGKPIT